MRRASTVRRPVERISVSGDGDRRERMDATIASALVTVGLCLPARKVWNHALIAYPLLALLGSVVGGILWPLISVLLKLPQRPRTDPDHV